ncbi:DUF397 domain-containing protein [Streptomyces sp. NBC_01275]|uniref:DUF397 domain-containing protein n=1 Tax=Streptomyces sp. NBC_01275 TaxID=2903807 RepID=UPI00225098C6|nr:DUF397 domain-containing protein [Streptomyces sp. NBC_01275]MCX4763750.1 DUF397 domain-containing protein [Streptomyces sp. NBC_01275]
MRSTYYDRRSSYPGTQSNCVEVADTAPHGRAVRDSKQPLGSPLLTVSRESWTSFLRQFGHSPQG